jgi:hypothetical protein
LYLKDEKMNPESPPESRSSSLNSYEEFKFSTKFNSTMDLAVVERSALNWHDFQFEPSQQTSMIQPMPQFVFETAKFSPA